MHSSQNPPPGTPPSSSSSSTHSQNYYNTFIQRSRPYLTEEQIESLRPRDTYVEAKDVTTRLSACVWIMQVGHALQFPVRTMATAMILFHRFRLFNKSPYYEYNYQDVAPATLFVACKIEDTLKKSREILATGYNLRHPQSEPINPDSSNLDEPTRRIIGIERLILESSSFDFRNRHAQPFLVKLAKHFKCSTSVAQRAWDISVDVYKTLAPLKVTPHALALASLDLACRLEDQRIEIQHDKFETSKEAVLSTIDDLLELYTNQKSFTIVGGSYDSNTYLTLRIELNKERNIFANGYKKHNGHSYESADSSPADVSGYLKTGYLASFTDRGTHGTIRFMIDPEREKAEKKLQNGSEQGKAPTNSRINGLTGSPWNGRS
ncbi:RNA polymerase II C-terminal domain kinase beta subunit [Rhizina undulata]